MITSWRNSQAEPSEEEKLKERDFNKFMEAVDSYLMDRINIPSDGLKDYDYWNAFESGFSPREVGISVMKNNGYTY